MNKKKFLKLILVSICLLYYSNSMSQNIKTKDGVDMGDRKEFISICVSSGLKQSDKLNIGVVEVGWEDYCGCVMNKLIPNLTSSEIIDASVKNDMMGLFFKNENLEIIMTCIEGFTENNEDALSNLEMKKTGDPEIDKIIRAESINNCIQGVLENDQESVFTEKLANEYCNCAIEKMFAGGYTFGEMMDAENENSDAFNEIVVPCLNDVLGAYQNLNKSEIHKDIIYGGGKFSRIPLIDYLGMGYKLKINVGGLEKYFLLDTGATDIIIDRDTERELLLNGTLTRDSYIGKSDYQLANNEIVEAQMVKVKNIVIGDYIISDVEIAIFDNGSLLCGISLLDKFKKWEIDKSSNSLILYK